MNTDLFGKSHLWVTREIRVLELDEITVYKIIPGNRHLLPSTLATWGVDTGYPDTGYPTLATHKTDTGYPDTGYPTPATYRGSLHALPAWRLLLPSTLATWGVDTGYPDTGYPTLATHKADTGYPDTGYPTPATYRG
ncbi:hypothetical protein OUZ56_024309 [Daphnia magna]|uniref:Uncharacterized protein n=1 Tax=Daphnia magna TaxID=35525 RepID=A0ABR0B0L6_9CRUS|nr:hypothetical protein OUZ56_024309 [Daphnia magna]